MGYFLAMAIVSTVLGIAMTAKSAADTRAGIEAYQRGDYAKAIAELENAAESGDAQAFFNLGILYADGRASPKDQVKAVTYFRAFPR